MTSSVPVKMARCVWMVEEAKYYLQVMKEKNRTTILENYENLH